MVDYTDEQRTAVALFQMSYQSAREDRMTREEARTAALNFLRGSTYGRHARMVSANFPADLLP